MGKLTYFPLLIDRWVAGTRALTYEQKGFYIDLLVWMYDSGKPVKDADHAARILQCDPRISRRLLADLSGKFRRTSAGHRHKVVDELIRTGGKIRGLQAINFPIDPDPDPEEEKIREEPPLTPPPHKPKKHPRKSQPSAAPVVPGGLDLESWGAYEKHRREIRKPKLKPESSTRLMRWLTEQPDQAAVVDQTIRNGWTGLFELNTGGNGNGRDKHESHFERNQRKLGEWYEANKDGPVDTGETGRILEFDAGTVRKTVD